MIISFFASLNIILKVKDREIYNDLMNKPKVIDEILLEGAARVRPKAQKLIYEIKKTVGVL